MAKNTIYNENCLDTMAHLQDRKWIGSEISKEYCDLAEKRLRPYLTQTKLQF